MIRPIANAVTLGSPRHAIPAFPHFTAGDLPFLLYTEEYPPTGTHAPPLHLPPLSHLLF